MSKYVTVTVNKIVIQIAKTTDIPGYTEGILEAFIPDDQAIKGWTEQQAKDWTLHNNRRMRAICKFLNEKEL